MLVYLGGPELLKSTFVYTTQLWCCCVIPMAPQWENWHLCFSLWLISILVLSEMSLRCSNLIGQNPREEGEAKRSRMCLRHHACSTSLKQQRRITNESWQHVGVQMNTDEKAEVTCDAWTRRDPHLLGESCLRRTCKGHLLWSLEAEVNFLHLFGPH